MTVNCVLHGRQPIDLLVVGDVCVLCAAQWLAEERSS